MHKYYSDAGTTPALMVKACLDMLHEKGDVFEVRIPGSKGGTTSGYFNDTTLAAQYISRINGKAQSIYVTANPVQPQLIARCANELRPYTKSTTTDSEILKRRWFLLDFDPVRPAGISSTQEEWQNAFDCATIVVEWLTSLGWPKPLMASSGNGIHVMYRIDMENTPEVTVDITAATKMIASVFSNEYVDIDTSVCNAARIWKVYGTISAKGSHTVERPHRVAHLLSLPEKNELLSHALIETMARPIRDADSTEFNDTDGHYIKDMEKWLADRKQEVVSGPRPLYKNEGQKWEIAVCPFNNTHVRPIVGLVNNKPIYRCLHNSCSAFRWKEYRQKIDPDYQKPEVVVNRLIEWSASGENLLDKEMVQTISTMGNGKAKVLALAKKELPKDRFVALQNALDIQRKEYVTERFGENGEKGNIVGLLARIAQYQKEGRLPYYWTAFHDGRIRVGPIGDMSCPRLEKQHELQIKLVFHADNEKWVNYGICNEAIELLAAKIVVNPLRNYMQLLEWDGTPRLDNWLYTYMGARDCNYTRAVGRKWLISAVARAMNPGCQADHMLIFEGKQGVGKSRAARIIGGEYYVEFSSSLKGNTATKDMVAAITGKIIVEMSELATMKRAEVETLKALLTSTTDEVRSSGRSGLGGIAEYYIGFRVARNP